MKELSIFIDESGDFGEYEPHSPYYIIAMVFHDQEIPISNAVTNLDRELDYIGLERHCIHTGPIIRKEENYSFLSVDNRRRIFNKMIAFIRQVNIRYKCFWIEKKHVRDGVETSGKLAKQIAAFIREHYAEFLLYEDVKIYYDNGQVEVSKILSSVFNALLPNVTFRKVMPSQYKLFQAADLFCTMCLLQLKMEGSNLSKSEITFFGNQHTLNKNYLKPLSKKEWK